MKTLAIANQKGGCGKTTTAINLAAALAVQGFRTLIIDLDSQGHSTLGLGHEPDGFNRSVYDVLVSTDHALPEILVDTEVPFLTLAPANAMLGALEMDLRNRPGKEFVLADELRRVAEDFDFCILDCAPPLSLLMLNALVASDLLLVTVQAQYYAVEGLRRSLETLQLMRQHLPVCEIKTLGILLTFVEGRTKLSRQVQQQLREYFGELIFDTVIHRNVRLAEAPSAGQSIFNYAPHSKGAEEYSALAQEILGRIGIPQPSVEGVCQV